MASRHGGGYCVYFRETVKLWNVVAGEIFEIQILQSASSLDDEVGDVK